MTTGATTSRFCSCSELPQHLDGGSTEVALRDSGSDTALYCSCSTTPSHLSRATAQEPEVQHAATFPEPKSRAHFEAASRTSLIVDRTAPAVESQAEPPELDSVSDLLPDESELYSASTHGKGGSEIVLTQRRVLLRGAADAKVLHSSLRLREIDSVAISRAAPNRRSLIWGLIGIGATVGMWQALDGVGNLRLIIAAIVLAMSALLLADYFLRPPDLEVVLRARSGSEMRVAFGQTHAEDADGFAARVIAMTEMASADS